VQGQILLSNLPTTTPWGKAPLLPLQGAALKGKTVAVIGPNANATQVRGPASTRVLLLCMHACIFRGGGGQGRWLRAARRVYRVKMVACVWVYVHVRTRVCVRARV
jgi:hypothetical protein